MGDVHSILVQKGPLPSSEIQQELVLRHNLSRDAARKRIQRLHSSGEIKRFMRLKAGGYLYYLPDLHSAELVITACKTYLPSYRPRLAHIVRLVDTFNIVSVFELCRLANLRAWVRITEFDIEKFLSNRNVERALMNPELVANLEELKLLGIIERKKFLTYSFLHTRSINSLIKRANKNFGEEAHILYLARDYLLDNKRAREITLYRTPSHESLSHKFDAIGYGGFRKRATILMELCFRRTIFVEDLIGYRKRIWSTMSRKKFPKPLFCNILAASFSEKAVRYALEKEMRVFRIDEDLNFHEVRSMLVSKEKMKKKKKLHGRLADAQGYAFESAIEKVFKRQGFRTETRKIFYLKKNKIAETGKRHLTDIDVFATKDENEVIMIECKSAKKQVSRGKLLRHIKNLNKISNYLVEKYGRNILVSSIVIGYCNKLDIVDAKRRTKIPITFFTPDKFCQEYKYDLKGEPKWLFTD